MNAPWQDIYETSNCTLYLGDCLDVLPHDGFGLVTVSINGQIYAMTNISMRMLTSRELYREQALPNLYIIDRGADGATKPKTQQIHNCSNGVRPTVAAALVTAHYMHLMESAR